MFYATGNQMIYLFALILIAIAEIGPFSSNDARRLYVPGGDAFDWCDRCERSFPKIVYTTVGLCDDDHPADFDSACVHWNLCTLESIGYARHLHDLFACDAAWTEYACDPECIRKGSYNGSRHGGDLASLFLPHHSFDFSAFRTTIVEINCEKEYIRNDYLAIVSFLI